MFGVIRSIIYDISRKSERRKRHFNYGIISAVVDAQAFLEYLQKLPQYKGQIAHIERLERREAVYGALDKPVHRALEWALKDQGIEQFYSHQADSINAARRGENVIVVTSTASGKTLCYNTPVLDQVLNDFK